MKKIMFDDNYGLTQAVLEGRKTMTRRLIPIEETKGGVLPVSFWNGKWVGAHGKPLKRQPYKNGEEVAVAQKYIDLKDCDAFYECLDKADPSFPLECIKGEKGCYNKMFVKAAWMPNRIRITNIKVERLKDISSEDCLKEGIEARVVGCHTFYFIKGVEKPFEFPKQAFAALIDKVSDHGTWDSNPYVFAYSFELIK